MLPVKASLDADLCMQLIVVYFVGYAVDEEHQVGEQRRMLTEADQEESPGGSPGVLRGR